eukprot:gene12058-16088_t
MTISLYDITVGQFLQTVDAAAGFLDRGLKHCTDEGANPDDLVGKRLTGDMLPLAFQVTSIAHHSIGAIEAVKVGLFKAVGGPAMPETYEGLIKIIADTQPADANDTQNVADTADTPRKKRNKAEQPVDVKKAKDV